MKIETGEQDSQKPGPAAEEDRILSDDEVLVLNYDLDEDENSEVIMPVPLANIKQEKMDTTEPLQEETDGHNGEMPTEENSNEEKAEMPQIKSVTAGSEIVKVKNEPKEHDSQDLKQNGGQSSDGLAGVKIHEVMSVAENSQKPSSTKAPTPTEDLQDKPEASEPPELQIEAEQEAVTSSEPQDAPDLSASKGSSELIECQECDYKTTDESHFKQHLAESHLNDVPDMGQFLEVQQNDALESETASNLAGLAFPTEELRPFELEELTSIQNEELSTAHNQNTVYGCPVKDCTYKTIKELFLEKHLKLKSKKDKPHKKKYKRYIKQKEESDPTYVKQEPDAPKAKQIGPGRPSLTKLMKCSKCTFTTYYKSVYLNHLNANRDVEKCVNQVVTQPKPLKKYPCSKCSYVGAQMAHLKSHMMTHEQGETIENCPNCNFQSTKYYLTRHIRECLKQTAGDYKCLWCDYVAKDPTYLKNHVVQHENGEPVVKCDYCDWKSTKKMVGIHHRQVHAKDHFKKIRNTGINTKLHFTSAHRYKCNQCSFAAKREYTMNLHVFKTHKQQKQPVFQCPYCPIRYIRRLLSQHINRDHVDVVEDQRDKEENEYVCPKCDHRERCRELFQKHLMDNEMGCISLTNTAETLTAAGYHDLKAKKADPNVRFPCDVCSFVATNQQAIYKHNFLHAANEPILDCPDCDYRTTKAQLNKHRTTEHGYHWTKEEKRKKQEQLEKKRKLKEARKARGEEVSSSSDSEDSEEEGAGTKDLQLEDHLSTEERIDEQGQPYTYYMCGLCSYGYHTKSNLETHFFQHVKGYPMVDCPFCDFRSTKKSVTWHKSKAHKGLMAIPFDEKQIYYCSKCKFGTRSLNVLEAHVEMNKHLKMCADGLQNVADNLKKIPDKNGVGAAKPATSKPAKAEEGDLGEHFLASQSSESQRVQDEPNTRINLQDFQKAIGLTERIVGHEAGVKEGMVTIKIRECNREENNGKIMYQCTLCSFKTNGYQSLYTHFLLHQKGQKIKQCPHCDFKSTQHATALHIKKMHPRKVNAERSSMRFFCNKCDYRTTVLANLQQHVKINKDRAVCTQDIKKKVLNRGHIKRVKTRVIGDFSCHRCGFRTPYLVNLELHFEKNRGREECWRQAGVTSSRKKRELLERKRQGSKIMDCLRCDFKTYCYSNLLSHIQSQKKYNECLPMPEYLTNMITKKGVIMKRLREEEQYIKQEKTEKIDAPASSEKTVDIEPNKANEIVDTSNTNQDKNLEAMEVAAADKEKEVSDKLDDKTGDSSTPDSQNKTSEIENFIESTSKDSTDAENVPAKEINTTNDETITNDAKNVSEDAENMPTKNIESNKAENYESQNKMEVDTDTNKTPEVELNSDDKALSVNKKLAKPVARVDIQGTIEKMPKEITEKDISIDAIKDIIGVNAGETNKEKDVEISDVSLLDINDVIGVTQKENDKKEMAVLDSDKLDINDIIGVNPEQNNQKISELESNVPKLDINDAIGVQNNVDISEQIADKDINEVIGVNNKEKNVEISELESNMPKLDDSRRKSVDDPSLTNGFAGFGFTSKISVRNLSEIIAVKDTDKENENLGENDKEKAAENDSNECTKTTEKNVDANAENIPHRPIAVKSEEEGSKIDKPDKKETSYVITEQGEKLWVCRYCDYTTYQSGSLLGHSLAHAKNEVILKCSECEFRATKSAVIKHRVRTHNILDNTGLDKEGEEEKLLKCQHCDYTCYGKGRIFSHTALHDLGKPTLKCNYCDFKSTRYALYLHRNSAHGIKGKDYEKKQPYNKKIGLDTKSWELQGIIDENTAKEDLEAIQSILATAEDQNSDEEGDPNSSVPRRLRNRRSVVTYKEPDENQIFLVENDIRAPPAPAPAPKKTPVKSRPVKPTKHKTADASSSLESSDSDSDVSSIEGGDVGDADDDGDENEGDISHQMEKVVPKSETVVKKDVVTRLKDHSVPPQLYREDNWSSTPTTIDNDNDTNDSSYAPSLLSQVDSDNEDKKAKKEKDRWRKKDPTDLKCTLCDFYTKGTTSMHIHMTAHKYKKTLKCTWCDFKYLDHGDMFYNHKKLDHPERIRTYNKTGKYSFHSVKTEINLKTLKTEKPDKKPTPAQLHEALRKKFQIENDCLVDLSDSIVSRNVVTTRVKPEYHHDIELMEPAIMSSKSTKKKLKSINCLKCAYVAQDQADLDSHSVIHNFKISTPPKQQFVAKKKTTAIPMSFNKISPCARKKTAAPQKPQKYIMATPKAAPAPSTQRSLVAPSRISARKRRSDTSDEDDAHASYDEFEVPKKKAAKYKDPVMPPTKIIEDSQSININEVKIYKYNIQVNGKNISVNIYQCNQCEYETNKFYQLLSHQRIHKEDAANRSIDSGVPSSRSESMSEKSFTNLKPEGDFDSDGSDLEHLLDYIDHNVKPQNVPVKKDSTGKAKKSEKEEESVILLDSDSSDSIKKGSASSKKQQITDSGLPFACQECTLRTDNRRSFLNHIRKHPGHPKPGLKCSCGYWITGLKWADIKAHQKEDDCDGELLVTYGDQNGTERTPLKRQRKMEEHVDSEPELKKPKDIKNESVDEIQVLKCRTCTFKTLNKSRFDQHNAQGCPNAPKVPKASPSASSTSRRSVASSKEAEKAKEAEISVIQVMSCSNCTFKTLNKAKFEEHRTSCKPSKSVKITPTSTKKPSSDKPKRVDSPIVIEDVQEVEVLSCKFCSYKTLNQNKYNAHMETCKNKNKKPETVEKVFKCPACFYKTKVKSNLDRHFEQCHTECSDDE